MATKRTPCEKILPQPDGRIEAIRQKPRRQADDDEIAAIKAKSGKKKGEAAADAAPSAKKRGARRPGPEVQLM